MEGGGVKLVFVVVVYLDCDEVVGAGVGDDDAPSVGGTLESGGGVVWSVFMVLRLA